MRRVSICIALATIVSIVSTVSSNFAAGLKIEAIYANSGDGIKTPAPTQLAGGKNNVVDAIEIDCASPQCTLILNAMVDVEDGDSTKEWLISAWIDNQSPIPTKTGYQGLFLKSGYVTGNWQGIYQVPKGTHTVKFYTFTNSSEYFVNAWSNTIIVASP